MGLDLHASRPMDEERRTRIAEKEGVDVEEVPEWTSPCVHVGAPTLGERETFEEYVRERTEEIKARAEREAEKGEDANWRFVRYWRERTVEEEMEKLKGWYDCENCPFLAELQGTGSEESMFLGITVSSCDFRGKRLSSDGEIRADLRGRLFRSMTTKEMVEYADELEKELERLRAEGKLEEEETYEEYCERWEKAYKALGGLSMSPKMSREGWEAKLHRREKNIKDALHWFRVSAKWGVEMNPTY